MDPWPPWKTVDTNTWQVDQNSIDIQLIEALLAAYNETFDETLRADYRGLPWKRCLQLMRTGEADLISGIFKRPDRQQYMIFIEPPYKTHSPKVFYVQKGKSRLIQTYWDLKGLKIGVQAGVTYFERFDNDPALNKEEVGEDVFNFRKLAHGRLDAVISTETQADFLIAQHALQGKFDKAVYRHNALLPVYFAVSKRSTHAVRASRLSTIARRLWNEGTFTKIIMDYFEALNQTPTLESQR
jgi:polar amino acid transport system substrate-binding protein